MPFVLAILGILLIVAGVRGKSKDLLAQMSDDGKHFIPWFAVVLIVSAVGISKAFRPVSNAMYVLIILALFLASSNQIITSFKSLSAES